MRFSPVWGFVILIAAAIFVAAIGSKYHPNRGDVPPVEQQREEDQKKEEEAQKHAEAIKAGMITFDQAKEGAIKATIEVEGRGTMVMELYPKAAPKTVEHFVDLCKKHFYDGLKFHRVEHGSPPNISVVQGGDPESRNVAPADFKAKGIGQHGSGQMVPLEVKLPHKQYSIGLARSQSPNSGDSQFYINLTDNHAIDGAYCVFGMIVQGQDIPAKIQIGDVIKSITVQ